jgi:hypothetical protein
LNSNQLPQADFRAKYSAGNRFFLTSARFSFFRKEITQPYRGKREKILNRRASRQAIGIYAGQLLPTPTKGRDSSLQNRQPGIFDAEELEKWLLAQKKRTLAEAFDEYISAK